MLKERAFNSHSNSFNLGTKLETCKDEFQKIGCFEERSPNYANLVLNDRNHIDWTNIKTFITQ